MKKLIYLGAIVLSANLFANNYGTIRGSVNYTHLKDPKIKIQKGQILTQEEQEKIDLYHSYTNVYPSIGIGIAGDFTYVNTTGISVRSGLELQVEYNQNNYFRRIFKDNEELKNKYKDLYDSKQQLITGYLSGYGLLGYTYKINNNMSVLSGFKLGIGTLINYDSMRELSVTPTSKSQSSSIIMSYYVPFSGLLEFNYNNLSFNIEVGAKYLFKQVSLSSGQTNKLTFDLKYTGDINSLDIINKLSFSTGISIGYNIY